MGMTNHLPAEPESYQALFLQHILHSGQHLLARLHTGADPLSPELQRLALHILSYALTLPATWSVSRDLLLALAPWMEQAGHREGWTVYLTSGLRQSEDLGDLPAQAQLQYYLGVLYLHQSNLESARQLFEASAAISSLLGRTHDHARALNRWASVARRQGDSSAARTLVERALMLLATVPDSQDELGYSHFVLGSLRFDERAWSEAAHLFEHALALWRQSYQARLVAWGLTNLGAALRCLERHEEAIDSYQQAIAVFETIGDPVHLAIAHMNLGNVYLTLRQPRAALAEYLIAERTFRLTGDRLPLARLYLNQGVAHATMGHWSEAEAAYQASISQFEQVEDRSHSWANAMDGLGVTYREQNQIERAIQTFETAVDRLARQGEPYRSSPVYEQLQAHLQEVLARRAAN